MGDKGSTARKARQMAHREMSTDEMFGLAFAQLSWLRSLITGRRARDAACQTMTNLSVSVHFLAERLGQVNFDDALRSAVDEEELPEQASEATLADLFAAPEQATADRIGYLQSLLGSCCLGDGMNLQRGMCEDCAERVRWLCDDLEKLRMRDFRLGLQLVVGKAKNAESAAKNLIMVARCARDEATLDRLGESHTDLGRLLDERRQTSHARYKRVVEAALKKAGSKGFKVFGGARSDEHRERCRKAQMGNTSRRKGEARKKSEQQPTVKIHGGWKTKNQRKHR